VSASSRPRLVGPSEAAT